MGLAVRVACTGPAGGPLSAVTRRHHLDKGTIQNNTYVFNLPYLVHCDSDSRVADMGGWQRTAAEAAIYEGVGLVANAKAVDVSNEIELVTWGGARVCDPQVT